METADLHEVLEELGLPEKAASIYLSLLGKTRMDVADIARASNIKRATCYEHLGLLLQKNFIFRVPIGKRTLYSANEPQKILQDFKKRTSIFEERIGEMSRLHETATNKPKVTFYEGKRELKKIYDESFKTVGEMYSIFPPEAFFESYTLEEYDEFDKQNTTHAIRSRDLLIKSRFNKKIREIRAANGSVDKKDKQLPEWFNSRVDTLIFNDTVALISLRDLSAVVIENKDIADLFKNMHSFMWKSL